MAKNSEAERVFLLYNHFRNEQQGLSYSNFIKMVAVALRSCTTTLRST